MIRINPYVSNMLVQSFKNKIEKIGFEKVIVGLSGGLDSSVSAAIAVKALGSSNVFPIFMPYKTSSAESRQHAELLCDTFGLKLETIDITPIADQFFSTLGDITAIRKGNIFSRLRMTILFDASARHDALVLGTANKSELLLGYITWYGDSACAINPIGDLYKTQVRELAVYLGIPHPIIEKKPSADHFEGQTDEADLGYDYNILDKILNDYFEESLSPSIIKEVHGEKPVEDVVGRLRRNIFKRELPLIVNIGQKPL